MTEKGLSARSGLEAISGNTKRGEEHISGRNRTTRTCATFVDPSLRLVRGELEPTKFASPDPKLARPRLREAEAGLSAQPLKRHRFLHANRAPATEDWPIRFTGTQEHTPELCRLRNDLQDEKKRTGHHRSAFSANCACATGGTVFAASWCAPCPS
jgi:hypothetical protein